MTRKKFLHGLSFLIPVFVFLVTYFVIGEAAQSKIKLIIGSSIVAFISLVLIIFFYFAFKNKN